MKRRANTVRYDTLRDFAPVDAVGRTQRALREALQSASFREALERLGSEPIDETPELFSAVLREELDRYQALVKRIGVRIDAWRRRSTWLA